MGIWPLYRENLLQGPSHVSLSIPGVPSNISKSVGGTQPALLLVPNIDFLKSFIKGDVGIADGILKGNLLSSLNSFTSKAPSAPNVNIPAVPKVPAVPAVPKVPVPGAPAVPSLPGTNIPTIPAVPGANNIPTIPAVPSLPGADNIPAVPSLPKTPSVPTIPEIPKVPNLQEMALKSFIKANGLDLPDLDKYKKNGQIKIPASDIKLPPSYDSVGLKAMEKTIMTSIFETQKPYMEIAKVVLSSMVKIEDIMARVMPLLSVIPYTSKSEKPIVKGGTSNGTKAIGYQNGIEIKKVLAELEKLSKIGGALTVNKDGTTSKDKSKKKPTSTDNPNLSDSDAIKQGKEWKIISSFYSTGDFDPTVEYLYTYNILPSDQEPDSNNNLTPEVVEDDNPYDKYKPKKIILGIFKSDGTPLNPNEAVKTISLNGILPDKVDTPFKKADWILKSPKWHFKENEYIWPSFGSNGEPVYLWEGPLGVTQADKKSPGNIWKIKKYKKGDKNRISDTDAIEGDPIIIKFDASDSGEYTNYFKDFTTIKTKMAIGLDPMEKIAIIKDIMGKLDVQSHLQNIFLYGSSKNSFYKSPGFPDAMKKSFKPYQIYVPESTNDPKLSGDGMIWVDPEADYDFKIIRVDPVSKIEYKNSKDEPSISTEIKSFIKNKITFKLENNSKFDIKITKNLYEEFNVRGIKEYTLDNWNYENGKILPNVFKIKITSESGDVVINKLYTILNLPKFGKQEVVTLDSSGKIKSSVETDIPLYSINVSNSNGDAGVTIDPSKIKNDFLATDKLFSEKFYGNGTKDKPQEIEIVKRYALTDLDTESYYIIEGIAVDDNKKADGGETNANASGDDGNKWYRLPHAFGAIIPFIKLLIDLATVLFPSIAKLLKLFSNPMSFITDVISEKVGEAFAIFSPEAFKKFEDTKKIMDKKKDIIEKGRTSDYSGQIKRNFNTSPLVGHVDVDQFSVSNPGKFKFILDGVAMIPFEIFGKSLPFGMELKMGNLIPEVPNVNIPEVPKVNVPTSIPAPGLSSTSVNIPTLPTTPNINVPTSIPTTGLASTSVTVPTLPTKPNIAVPNVGIPSITLPKVKSPLRLILGKPGKAKTKDCDSSNNTTPATGKSNNDYLNALNNPTNDKNQGNNANKGNSNDKFLTSTWYSTGQFIKGVDYNYFYVTEDTKTLLLEVDNLINPSGSTTENELPGGTNANNTDTTVVPTEDLQLAKEKIANALSKDPTNPLLKLKLSEINKKILDSAILTQPILKLALGMVATPIKVVACIVQWIMDFFKSLINPMMLPAKIIEFVSFKWIQKFFSASGLLKTAGINFNPAIIQEWVSLASKPNVNVPSVPNVNASKASIPTIPTLPTVPGVNLPTVPTLPTVPGVNLPTVPTLPTVPKIPKVDLGLNITGDTSDIMKNIKPHNGKYALPDNFKIADLSKFLDVSFMATLPTYDAKTIRENPKLPFVIFDPILCFIEKLINAFIDFIWSTLGIEAIIPPPHIKLCKTKTPEEINKLQNGESPKLPSDTAPDDTTEVDSTMPYQEKKASDSFIYEVKLPDGKIVTLKNDEELQKYLDENKDIGFDLQF
jgi:hypothetical protein